MKRKVLAQAALGGAILAALSGCGRKEAASERPVPARVTGVGIVTTAQESVADTLEVVGTVRARNEAQVAARIAGTVSSLKVREGDRVGRGQLLLTIAATEGSAGAAGAAALVDEASRGVEEAAARKRLVDATFDRYERLYKDEAVTRQEYDTRLMEREVAAQGVARAEARLRQVREEARAATAVAGYTRVTAPLGGIVTSRKAELGMTVFPGTPLVTVEEEGNYRLELNVPESHLPRVRVGSRIEVAVEGVDGAREGRVAEVTPAVDPASRTFVVKVDLAGKGVRSGMYGHARFPVGSQPGLLVPRQAVLERGSLTYVWAVGPDSTARMRLVKTGRTVGERVEVLSGLSAGERVVASGVERVTDGARVE
jgi:RND family efflux transporter MFP subunit